ncbi:MAG: hypothetical protein AAB384_01940 [Patescibacteria group bacterium]
MRNHAHKHTPEHSMRRMGAGTLVGFLALVGVAAAAAGVSSERNVRDLAQFRPMNSRAAYGDVRAAYGNARGGYATSTVATTTPSRDLSGIPVAALTMSNMAGGPVDLSKTPFVVATNGGYRVAAFGLNNYGQQPITLKRIGIRVEAKKVNGAALKLAEKNPATVNACGLVSFSLMAMTETGGVQFGNKLPTAKEQNGVWWDFTGTHTLQAGKSSSLVLMASAAVTNQQLVQLLEGCSFTPYVLATDLKVVDNAGKTVKVIVDGKDLGNKVPSPAVVVKSAAESLVTVNMVWSSASPAGSANMGDDKTIAILRVSNSSSSTVVNLKGLPMNLNASFAPQGDRELKIYKDSISSFNLVYQKVLNAKTWRMDDKLGLYTLTVGSPFTSPIQLVGTKDFYVTYDVLDASVNDVLCISPTRTLSSFVSSKALQFPAGTSSPATRCLNY